MDKKETFVATTLNRLLFSQDHLIHRKISIDHIQTLIRLNQVEGHVQVSLDTPTSRHSFNGLGKRSITTLIKVVAWFR